MMAQNSQGSSSRNTEILDIPRRAYNQRWIDTKRYADYDTRQDERRYSETNT